MYNHKADLYFFDIGEVTCDNGATDVIVFGGIGMLVCGICGSNTFVGVDPDKDVAVWVKGGFELGIEVVHLGMH